MINNNNQYNDNLSEVSERYNRLASLQNYFKSNHNLTPIIGAEIEFYLSDNIYVKDLESKIGHDIKLEKEFHEHQYFQFYISLGVFKKIQT